jgi:hypothetical protein
MRWFPRLTATTLLAQVRFLQGFDRRHQFDADL